VKSGWMAKAVLAIELGWDYQTIQRQPPMLLEAIGEVWDQRAKADKKANRS